MEVGTGSGGLKHAPIVDPPSRPPPHRRPSQLRAWFGRRLYYILAEPDVNREVISWLGWTTLPPALLLWRTLSRSSQVPLGFVFPTVALMACQDRYSLGLFALASLWIQGLGIRSLFIPLLAVPGGERVFASMY